MIYSQALAWQLAHSKTQRVFAGWMSRLQVVKELEGRAEDGGYRIKKPIKDNKCKDCFVEDTIPGPLGPLHVLLVPPSSKGFCSSRPTSAPSWRTALGLRICLSIHSLQGILPQEAHTLGDMGASHSWFPWRIGWSCPAYDFAYIRPFLVSLCFLRKEDPRQQ